MKINRPNQLTILRLLLIPPFLVFTIEDNVTTRIVALVFFIEVRIEPVICHGCILLDEAQGLGYKYIGSRPVLIKFL